MIVVVIVILSGPGHTDQIVKNIYVYLVMRPGYFPPKQQKKKSRFLGLFYRRKALLW